MASPMTARDVLAQRLHSQQIAAPQPTQPSMLLAALGAIQGQDYTGAKWSLGLRAPGSTDASIEQAIASKAILRTWAMRGTLHFVAAHDIRWLVALFAPRIIASFARRYRELELDAETMTQSSALLAHALRDGAQLDRTALLALLEQHDISTQGQRGLFMVQRASYDGLICQTVTQRNKATYIALNDSLPHGKTMKRDEAVAELATRYFTTRGAATVQDFMWWSGLTVKEARAGLEAVQAQLVEETIAGQTYWLSRGSQPAHEYVPALYLLPGFDEYLLSYRDRSAALDPQHSQKVVPGNNGMFMPTIVSDGRVVGLWKRVFKKGAAVISAHPFTSLSEAEREAFAAAAQRYGAFLGLPVVLA